MVQIGILLLTIFLILIVTGATFYMLFLQFKEQGAVHAVIGFFFFPYTYVWGWLNVKRLKLMDVMLFWSFMLVLAVAFPVITTMQTARNLAQAIESGEIAFPADSSFTSDPMMALGSENAVLMGSAGVGQRVTGRLEDAFTVHNWTMRGEAGQMVTIRCNATNGEETDPRVNVLGPDGALLIGDDDGGSDMNALIAGYVLPASGDYVLQVDGWSAGSYELIVE